MFFNKKDTLGGASKRNGDSAVLRSCSDTSQLPLMQPCGAFSWRPGEDGERKVRTQRRKEERGKPTKARKSSRFNYVRRFGNRGDFVVCFFDMIEAGYLGKVYFLFVC